MSTPPATPTNPPATPPATVNDLKLSTAETFTDCVVLVVASWPICVLPAMNALVVTLSSVTPTPPATPTNPPPALALRPKTFSDDEPWTARPWKQPGSVGSAQTTVPKPDPVNVPV